jgi:ABC-type antimicrobial peptide transport system permease subunit
MCYRQKGKVIFVDTEKEFKEVYPDYDLPSLTKDQAVIVPGKDNGKWAVDSFVNVIFTIPNEIIMQIMYDKLFKMKNLDIYGNINISSLASELSRSMEDGNVYYFKKTFQVSHVGDMIPTFGSKNDFYVILNKNYIWDNYLQMLQEQQIKTGFNLRSSEGLVRIDLVDEVKQLQTSSISNALIFNFTDRMEIYDQENYESIREIILPRANKIIEVLDIHNMVYSSVPIVDQLDSLRYVVPFLKITINTVIIFLLVLNFTLIYHIFGLTLQDKLFHFGIMRTLGFKRFKLYLVLVAQAFCLSVFSLLFSFPLTFILFGVFNRMDLKIQFFGRKIFPSFGIIFFSIICNFLIPTISLLIPGFKFFSKKIMESIDNRAELFSSLKLQKDSENKLLSRAPILPNNR